jgi:N-acetylmuramoyl-L-alanine amidase
MYKLIISFIIVLTILFYNNLTAQDFSKIDKVVIDPGHGGKDPGAVGSRAQEKKIALAIGLKLGKLIEENFSDVKVIYTRKTDVFIELFKRAEIANKAKADLFISIHCNATASSTAKGTETFILGTHRTDKNLDVAKKENSAILLEADYSKNYNNFDPNSPESYITLSLIQGAYREQSMDLAQNIQKQFKHSLHRIDRGVQEAGFLVLVYTTMPSILIETGFISNPEEETFLISEEGQNYLAKAIFNAFSDYKQSIEGVQDQSTPKNDLQTKPMEEQKVTQNNPAIDSNQANTVMEEEVYFSVQFATRSSQVKKMQEFDPIPEVWFYRQNELYKYVSGKYKSFNEAMKAMNKMREGKYKDAFVVAFKNGQRITNEEAKKLLNSR